LTSHREVTSFELVNPLASAANSGGDSPLVVPAVRPALDPQFRPAALASRAFQRRARDTGRPVRVRFALEQKDGAVSRFTTDLLPSSEAAAAADFFMLERMVKLALWSRGGFRLHVDAPAALVEQLRAHFRESPTGRFDSFIVGERVHDHPIEVVATTDLPPERSSGAPIGGHLDGCRIGFDLGGSDRKVAAVVEGRVVWSEEVEWDPYHQPDPQYHWDGIMDSLRSAAAHLPRVDAIGGSAAGVYVDNRVRFSPLFRGISAETFQNRVRNMFLEIRDAWHGVPFEVANDGDVTALAASMSITDGGGVLGIALGTSTAGGYVTGDRRMTPWLNEIAFVPVDYRPGAPRDEWSGDDGCCVQYLSQQAVGRLLAPARIELPLSLSLPARLKELQSLMLAGDPRAKEVYATLGVYLGYALAQLANVYDFRHVLVLGRVTSGPGGAIILEAARDALHADLPELEERVDVRMPSEKDKRHGQAIAAASLPAP
jgi:predicted NBD/HSP70 family sugar kinase